MRAMVWNGVVSLLFLPLGTISGKGVCFTNWKIGFVGIMEYGGFQGIWLFGGLVVWRDHLISGRKNRGAELRRP